MNYVLGQIWPAGPSLTPVCVCALYSYDYTESGADTNVSICLAKYN